MNPVLSVVVLGFRNFDTVTRNCLESLRPWLLHPEIEVLVLDNASPDNSAELTKLWCASHPEVRCLISDRNLGFAGGMNWGCRHAKGDWLLLVNNDTVFPAYSLDALLMVMKEAPAKVAMLGPVTNAAGNGQRLWKPEATHADWLQIGQQLHENPTRQLMPAYRCDFFCIAIRHDVWVELNGLDEAFGLGYYEDFDFSLRLKAAGYEQMITEDVFVLHVGSATFQGSKEARSLIKKNKELLRNKHPNARFEHTREGNLAVLVKYEQMLALKRNNAALNMRLDLRKKALFEDVPRSFLKRWLWCRKVHKILNVMQ